MTSYIYGLSLSRALISSGEANNILMITADTYSKFIDPNDSSLVTLFGDEAAATLIVSEDNIIDGELVEVISGPIVQKRSNELQLLD